MNSWSVFFRVGRLTAGVVLHEWVDEQLECFSMSELMNSWGGSIRVGR